MEKITMEHGTIKKDFITKGTIDDKIIDELISRLTDGDKALIKKCYRIGVISQFPAVGDKVSSEERTQLTELKARLNCSWNVFRTLCFDFMFKNSVDTKLE